MHLKAIQGKEVVVQIINRSGILADLARFIADRGLSLLALNASVTDGLATVRLVTDDNLRTDDVLREHGYNPHEEDVILLTIPHKPGMLHRVSEILAEAMIDTHHIYSTAMNVDGDCGIVLHTENDAQALILLNTMLINA
jgi:hypothetical protein